MRVKKTFTRDSPAIWVSRVQAIKTSSGSYSPQKSRFSSISQKLPCHQDLIPVLFAIKCFVSPIVSPAESRASRPKPSPGCNKLVISPAASMPPRQSCSRDIGPSDALQRRVQGPAALLSQALSKSEARCERNVLQRRVQVQLHCLHISSRQRHHQLPASTSPTRLRQSLLQRTADGTGVPRGTHVLGHSFSTNSKDFYDVSRRLLDGVLCFSLRPPLL